MSVVNGWMVAVAIPRRNVDARFRVGKVVSIDGNAGGIQIVAGHHSVWHGRTRYERRCITNH